MTPRGPSANSKKLISTVSGKLPVAIEIWHQAVTASFDGDSATAMQKISECLSDDVVFEPPTYIKQRKGKNFAMMALQGVLQLFENFVYVKEFVSETEAMLEFKCTLKGTKLILHGADVLTLSKDGKKIVKFSVLGRPISALQKVLEHQTKFMEEFLKANEGKL